MRPYLATAGDQHRTDWVKRFATRLWTVDFARPMMAAVTAPAADRLRVDLDFLSRRDLAGLIWASEDRWSHPLLRLATDRDYRRVVLAFDWVGGAGLMPLDAVNGPTLTIEGRDAQGVAQTWYVRLWNYAVGTPLAARIELDFGMLRAGFGTDGEPVFTGDVDRMFVSLVPDAFDGSDTPLGAPVRTYVELRNLVASGAGSVIAIGDAFLPEHRLRMCSGYDDSYNQTPERLVEQWRALGYRGPVNHYVGMSHHYALAWRDGRFEVAGGLCGAAVAWHRALARALKSAGYGLILSVSYELFDANAPVAWAQRDVDGARALTGWEPPSTLLSPCSPAAMAWLQGVALEFMAIVGGEGLGLQFQVGEPWWWVGAGHRPCFYDAATQAAWLAHSGVAPPAIRDIRGARSAVEHAFLDWLGEQLAASTGALVEAVRARAGDVPVTSHLLFFSPQVLAADTPELFRANMPAGWAFPAWDVLQLEDYDFVTAGDAAGMRRGRDAVTEQLGYPLDRQQYLAGFVLNGSDRGWAWPRVADAAADAFDRGVPEVLLWAWPQIARDGFTWLGEEETAMAPFDDVRFPLELGMEASGGPQFHTQVALMASGHEQRNIQWAEARLQYDAGLGVRSEADLRTLLAFFRARRGQAQGFRFRDPLDFRSCDDGDVSAQDQLLGVGDGIESGFQLVKRYGGADADGARRITRPVAASVRVSVAGVERADWTLEPGGTVRLAVAPAAGAEVRAGFEFDVPVRFATDRLDISLSGWRSGEVPGVPVIEVRE